MALFCLLWKSHSFTLNDAVLLCLRSAAKICGFLKQVCRAFIFVFILFCNFYICLFVFLSSFFLYLLHLTSNYLSHLL